MLGLEFPPINEILRWQDFFPTFNKIALIAVVAAALGCLIFWLAGSRDGTKAPRGIRNLAEMIVNGAHTSPAMAGMVFERAGARMSAMWHLVVDHETVGPVFSEMRTRHDGPVVISQDLTVFNVTKESVVARQTIINPYAWPVVGLSNTQGPPMAAPLPPPEWWADALIND